LSDKRIYLEKRSQGDYACAARPFGPCQWRFAHTTGGDPAGARTQSGQSASAPHQRRLARQVAAGL